MTCKHWIKKNTWWASHLLLALLYCWSQPSLSGAKEVDRLTTSSREESSGFQTGGQQGEEEEEMSANQNHSANHLSCCKPFLEYKAQEQDTEDNNDNDNNNNNRQSVRDFFISAVCSTT